MKATNLPIIVGKSYPVSKEKVWSALTNLEEMKQWFFPDILEFKAEVGFETRFLITNEGRNFTHIFKVMESVPYEKLKLSWKYEEWSGDSTACFEMSETDGQTNLSITCIILEDFPDDIPEFNRESAVAGWEYILGEALKNHLFK